MFIIIKWQWLFQSLVVQFSGYCISLWADSYLYMIINVLFIDLYKFVYSINEQRVPIQTRCLYLG